jgi:similar to stage IV sporulation protein
MLFLYRFFCGILEVEFFGVYTEKVLNLAAKNRISIWSARYREQKIICKITVKDFLKLPKILRKSGIRVHIKRKMGLPFFIKRYNKRLGILVGFIVFFCVLQVMSSYIWVIDVVGNKTVSDSQILSVCSDLGVKIGAKRSKINSKADAQKMLLGLDKLAWGSINIEGCKITVNVTETVEFEEDITVPCNLKAECDGVITHIDVKAGNCLVKIGDVVAKGDVLVSGIIENQSGTRFIHSIGEVEALTETPVSLEQELVYKVKVPNGKTKTKKVLDFFNLKIPLYLGGEVGEFECERNLYTARLFSQNLPIKIYSKNFIFTKTENRKITVDEAKEMLLQRLKKDFLGDVKDQTFYEMANSVKLQAVLVNKKNVAVSEKLIFGIGNE